MKEIKNTDIRNEQVNKTQPVIQVVYAGFSDYMRRRIKKEAKELGVDPKVVAQGYILD